MQIQGKELVAVAHPLFAMDEAALKHAVTMFNRIAFQGLSIILTNNHLDTPKFAKDKARLSEIGILFEPNAEKLKSSAALRYKKNVDLMRQDANEILMAGSELTVDDFILARDDESKRQEIKETTAQTNSTFASRVASGKIDLEKFLATTKRLSVNTTRMLAIHIRDVENLDACAIIPSAHNSLDQDNHRLPNHDLMKIVLPTLRVPDEHTPWEQIIEYRKDCDSQNKFLDLKNCFSDIARGSVTWSEVEDRLEYLLNQYRKHLVSHQIKTTTTTLEAFVITTALVIEKFAGLRQRQRPNTPLTVEHRKLALLEGESTSPGSELAIVLKSRSMLLG